MNEIYNDFIQYKDSYGLIHPKKQIPVEDISGNGLVYTAEYMLAILFKDAMTDQIGHEILGAISSCEKEPGLFKRHPNKTDQEGPDDYVAIGLMSFYLDKSIAKRIIEYGKMHWFIYNNENPGKFSLSSFFLRFPALICHFYYSAGLKPNIFLRITWLISVFLSSFKDKNNHDNWSLTYLKIRVARNCPLNLHCFPLGRYRIIDILSHFYLSVYILITDYWTKRFYSYYPHGFGEVKEGYFKDHFGVTDHPIARYLKGRFL